MSLNRANENLKAEMKKVHDESRYCHVLQKRLKVHENELAQIRVIQQLYNEWKFKQEDKLVVIRK